MLCVYSVSLWSWGMTHWSAVYALVVEQSFLQGDFFCSYLLPCHILSAGKTLFRNGINTLFLCSHIYFRKFYKFRTCFNIYLKNCPPRV